MPSSPSVPLSFQIPISAITTANTLTGLLRILNIASQNKFHEVKVLKSIPLALNINPITDK